MAKRRRELLVAQMKEKHDKEIADLRNKVKTSQKNNWNKDGGGHICKNTYDIIRRKTPRRKNSLL